MNEDDLIKNKGARVSTRLSIFQRPKGIQLRIQGENLSKFELFQVFMHVLNTCKNEDDRVKNEGAKVATKFLPL